MPRPVLLFWLWLFALSLNTVYVLSQAMVARLFGMKASRIQLGFGPRLLKWRMGGCEYEVHAISTTGTVEFATAPIPDAQVEEGVLARLPPTQHATVLLVPWVLIIGLALVSLGFGEGLHQFLSGFMLPIELWALPRRVDHLVAMLRHGDLLEVWGRILAKTAAYNLMPAPFLAGGTVLRLPWRHRRVAMGSRLQRFALVCFALILCWSAYVAYLFLRAFFA
ncbi:site-2 protease family protein [Myxococcus sp. K15C18031901]|uniref:site-2 protease family protein n=1 Tax=Myxococcus dinghuensis TaxID=2906761 RepID=UPI0020A72559|nr:site-2 protease family protein [Myxococcus dinghuensis]MCP3100018.1 site-2 protease family protein [Myxococcus dinghuensis]